MDILQQQTPTIQIMDQQPDSNPWYKKWWGILLMAGSTLMLLFVIIFGLMVWDYAKRIKSGQVSDPGLAENVSDSRIIDPTIIGNADNYALGPASSSLVIVEFADYNCSRSKSSYITLKKILDEYPDRFRLVYRDYPVISESSVGLAIAAHCAGEQGRFWTMHDKLYENQGLINSEDDLLKIARLSGVQDTQFIACMDKKKYQPRVRKDLSDALKLDLPGTPSWFFNGYRLDGDIPIETFKEIINKFK